MQDDRNKPAPFPVRQLLGQAWEVLISTENIWLQCGSEPEARLIARAPILRYEALEQRRRGEAFAAELDALGTFLQAHGIGFGARFFFRRASEIQRSP